MPILHYMSNSSTPEVDIRTGFTTNMFIFRFIDRISHEIKQVTAVSDKHAREVLGGDLIFAARFRQNDNCQVTGR